MAFITKAVSERLDEAGAEIFFVSGAATKWWNARRDNRQQEVALLGGWYWTFKHEEAGPFRTPSAAWRDVYYRRILREKPPLMERKDLARANREGAREAGKDTPPRRRKVKVTPRRQNITHLRAVA